MYLKIGGRRWTLTRVGARKTIDGVALTDTRKIEIPKNCTDALSAVLHEMLHAAFYEVRINATHKRKTKRNNGKGRYSVNNPYEVFEESVCCVFSDAVETNARTIGEFVNGNQRRKT